MALLFNFSGTCIWNIVKMSYCEHTKLQFGNCDKRTDVLLFAAFRVKFEKP